jgi:two-component system phosphate regulon response regulator PhoB
MSRKILVVDDNVDSVLILRSILEAQGFTVRVAHGGSDALSQLADEIPDIILLDVMMPEMSGLEVLERIRAMPATAAVPVIMVTAKMQDEDLMAGYQVGADYYITKPCTAKQLLYGIGLVLDRAEHGGDARAVEKDQVT